MNPDLNPNGHAFFRIDECFYSRWRSDQSFIGHTIPAHLVTRRGMYEDGPQRSYYLDPRATIAWLREASLADAPYNIDSHSSFNVRGEFVATSTDETSPETRPWQVGDRVRITEHTLPDVVGREGVITNLHNGDTTNNCLGITVQEANGASWMSAHALELLTPPVDASTPEPPRTPQVGDRVRITAYNGRTNHRSVGWEATVVRLTPDRGNRAWVLDVSEHDHTFGLSSDGQMHDATAVEVITPRPWQIGDRVRITEHRMMPSLVDGTVRVITAINNGDGHMGISAGGWLNIDGLELVEGVDASTTRPWQVGDRVRITGHEVTEHIGKTGVISELNNGRTAGGALGISVRMDDHPDYGWAGDEVRVSTALELLDTPTAPTTPTRPWQVGDRVTNIVHPTVAAFRDYTGAVAEVVEVGVTRAGAGRNCPTGTRIRIVEHPDRPTSVGNAYYGHTGMTLIEPAPATADRAWQVGDRVRVTRHEAAPGLVGFIGEITETGNGDGHLGVTVRVTDMGTSRSAHVGGRFVNMDGLELLPTTPQVGDRVRVTAHRDGDVVGRVGVLERTPQPMSNYYHVRIDGTLWTAVTGVEPAPAEPVAPSTPQVGDTVRITGHSMARVVGLTGRLTRLPRPGGRHYTVETDHDTWAEVTGVEVVTPATAGEVPTLTITYLREQMNRAISQQGLGDQLRALMERYEHEGWKVDGTRVLDYLGVEVASFRDAAMAQSFRDGHTVTEVPWPMVEALLMEAKRQHSWCGVAEQWVDRLRPVTTPPVHANVAAARYVTGMVTAGVNESGRTVRVAVPGRNDVTVTVAIEPTSGNLVVAANGRTLDTLVLTEPSPF